MTSAYPLLWILFVFPLSASVFLLRAKTTASRDLRRFAAEDVWPGIVDLTGARIRAKQRWLRLTALFLIAASLTGPQWGRRWQKTNKTGYVILFAVDVSKSMLARDVEPNRLERAKLAIADFLSRIGGSRMGLVAFAGRGFMQCPLTTDVSAFQAVLDALDVQSIPEGGTAISEAIDAARKAFRYGGDGKKILILITDGENHEGNPVSAAQAAAGEGIRIYTIGVGSPEGVTIPVKDQHGGTEDMKDAQGNTIRTRLDEKMLREIAAAGKGSYFKGAGFSLGLDKLYRAELSADERTALNRTWQKKPVNRYQYPLLLAVTIIAAELWLGFAGGRKVKKA
ncbi:MAG: VWA domain-containing protein [Bacillota bacterium]